MANTRSRRPPAPPRPAAAKGIDRRLVAIGAGIAAVIVIVLVVVSVSGGSDEPTRSGELEGVAASQALFAGIEQSGTGLGDPAAPVTLVEFADLQCPFCAQWAAETLPTVIEEYVRPGLVRIEYRGLAFIGPESELGLRAAVAAAEQDRLWQVVELLFHNQGVENSGWLDEQLIRDIGASVDGLDAQRVLDASSGAGVTDGITAMSNEATALGVAATPMFAAGPTGGELELLAIDSLDAAAFREALDALLADR